LFAQARDLLAGRSKRPDPTPAERFGVALEHARLALRLQGDTRKTALEFRKHLGWYTKGLPGASELRQRLFAIESMAEAETIFADYLAESVEMMAARTSCRCRSRQSITSGPYLRRSSRRSHLRSRR